MLIVIFLFGLHFSYLASDVSLVVSPDLQAGIKSIFISCITLTTVSISLIRCVPNSVVLLWKYQMLQMVAIMCH